MGERSNDDLVDSEVAADIIGNLGELLATFHESDLALQSALSTLSSRPERPTVIYDLQHIDLITQVHADLAKMLPVLAKSLQDMPATRHDLRAALTLRSLQDALIDPGQSSEAPTAGDLSLF